MRSLVNKIIPLVQAGKVVKLFRSHRADYQHGGQKRDFVYIDDIVSAIQYLGTVPGTMGLYNVGSGNARTWNDLANAVFSALGQQPRIEYAPMPESIQQQYQYFTEARIEKIRRTGWTQPTTTLEDGVLKYVQTWSNPVSC